MPTTSSSRSRSSSSEPGAAEPGLTAVLHRPAGNATAATVVLDASQTPGLATITALLLASRGALVLLVHEGLELGRERVAAVPGAQPPVELDALTAPPNVGVREDTREAAAQRAAAWDALLARLGARPRTAALS